MTEIETKDVINKTFKEIFDKESPYSVEEIKNKFAFDVRLPVMVRDSITGEETYTVTVNSLKFITNSNMEKRDNNEGWILDKKPVKNLKELLDDLYQLNKIVFDKDVEYEMPNDETIILPSDYEGTFTIYYFKYPELLEIIFEGTEEEQEIERLEQDEDYEFELDADVLEVMPYGIAADLLKMDMISNYGKYFDERYRELKNSIDPRRNSASVMISGGIDI